MMSVLKQPSDPIKQERGRDGHDARVTLARGGEKVKTKHSRHAQEADRKATKPAGKKPSRLVASEKTW